MRLRKIARLWVSFCLRVRLPKRSVPLSACPERPLVPVYCRVTWTTRNGPETGQSHEFPRRFAAPRETNSCACPVLRFAAPLQVQARPAPSGRSGVDGDKVSLEDSHGNEKETPMANALGYVSETKTGFEGALAMMNLSAAIRIGLLPRKWSVI